MKCKMCGTSFVPGENKFCEGCGMELPMVAAETVAPKAVPENDDELPAAGTLFYLIVILIQPILQQLQM